MADIRTLFPKLRKRKCSVRDSERNGDEADESHSSVCVMTALPPEIVSSSEEQRDVRDRQNDDLPLEAVDNEIQPMDIFVSTYIILFDR